MVILRNAKANLLVLAMSLIMFTGFSQEEYTVSDATKAYNEGVELVGQDKLDEALDKFVKAVEICDMIGDEESVETRMSAASAIPGVQYRIASGYLQENDFEKGIPALEKTIALAEEYDDYLTIGKAKEQLAEVYYVYASGLMKQSKFEQSESYFNKSIEVDSGFARAYLAKAYLFKQQDMDEKFKKTLLKSIEVAKSSNDRRIENAAKSQGYKFFLKQALDAFSANEVDKTIELINSSLQFDDSQSDTYYLLLQAYNKKSEWDNAIEAGNKALELEQGNADKKAGIYYEMANAYKEKGEKDAACESYKNAMAGPYTENAKYQREHILKCTE